MMAVLMPMEKQGGEKAQAAVAKEIRPRSSGASQLGRHDHGRHGEAANKKVAAGRAKGPNF